MPKRGRKFITEFLVPNLNEETFGVRLAWVECQKLIFQMQWNHKSATDWTEDDFQVFVEWDKKRGHYRPDEKDYFTKSKQRFRAVLNKSIQDKEITQLQSEDKNIKLYFLGPGEAIPPGKFDVVKDTVDDKKVIPSCDLSCIEPDFADSAFSLEQNQLTNPSFYYNALKDHNYPSIEEEISESDYCTSYEASKNDLLLCTLNSTEKNVSKSFNILELPNDEEFWENECLPVLNLEERHSLLTGRDISSLVLQSVGAQVSSILTKDSSSRISIKRKIENTDNCSTKKNKILLYLNKS